MPLLPKINPYLCLVLPDGPIPGSHVPHIWAGRVSVLQVLPTPKHTHLSAHRQRRTSSRAGTTPCVRPSLGYLPSMIVNSVRVECHSVLAPGGQLQLLSIRGGGGPEQAECPLHPCPQCHHRQDLSHPLGLVCSPHHPRLRADN